MKKLLSIMATIMVVLTLAGCGSKANSEVKELTGELKDGLAIVYNAILSEEDYALLSETGITSTTTSEEEDPMKGYTFETLNEALGIKLNTTENVSFDKSTVTILTKKVADPNEFNVITIYGEEDDEYLIVQYEYATGKVKTKVTTLGKSKISQFADLGYTFYTVNTKENVTMNKDAVSNLK